MTEPARGPKTYWCATLGSWLVILGIVGFIAVKNTLAYRSAGDRALTSVVPAPDVSLEISGRMVIGQTNLLSKVPGGIDPVLASRQRKRMLEVIDSAAVTPADKLNAIPVAGELGGAEAAIHRLDQLEPKLTPNALLAGDAKVLRDIYMRGTEVVSGEQREGLVKRHEWFGQLALVFGLPAQDSRRQAIIEATIQTTVLLGVIFFAAVVVLVIGLGLLIVGIVLLTKGKIRTGYRPNPPTGPPVYLETFAIWLGMWVVTSLIVRLAMEQQGIFISELIAAVVSLCVAFWPLRRGVGWLQLRADLGWNGGRGALREILAGVIGYFAGLPVLALGFVVTGVLVRASASHPTHPILRELGHGASALSLVGIYIAACLLAPAVEETMFRGALYGHLRRRLGPIFSAVVVSFLFAAIHPQGWAAIPLLGSIGFVLAMIREWRGTLLASMAAHGLNNAFGVTLVVLIMR
jgi:membrane protease YdiL (CAAX protease family)